MLKQAELYERFAAMHQQGRAFVMPNAWDGASAVLLQRAGFACLGSSSLALALAAGKADGMHAISREQAVTHASFLTCLTGLPVNGDLEDGFGPAADDCRLTVEAAIAGGLAGLGIEDTTANPARPLHDFDSAVARVRAAASAARGRILLTARTDNFLLGNPDLDDTLRRLVAFAEVGADVLYAPGLPDMGAIGAVVRAVAPKPVNVVLGPQSGPVPLQELQRIGVRRVSLGGALYRYTLRALSEVADKMAQGDLAAACGGLPASEIVPLFKWPST
ncbi:MAG: isocitrate lyase/phosphoenolpyruvate mutase family protein [Planctomycetales bacterium]|nr:isocitrate lyase/phosphoenolpyruvate mutase family protein [Planctomycetales bacterium]